MIAAMHAAGPSAEAGAQEHIVSYENHV
jgi:hypothetical protein